MAASALTLWRAQPLSLPLELCENLFYDAVFSNHRSASDYSSSNEHLPGAAFPLEPPTFLFIRVVVFVKLLLLFPLLPSKLHSLVLCQLRHPNPSKPSCPPTDALIRSSSDCGASKSPVSRLINRKGGVLLAMRQAAGI